MKIFVTGGLGFMGSNFIRYMLDKHPDISIVNYDSMTYAGKGNNLQDIKNDQRYKFIKGDILDLPFLEENINQSFDAVINYAAQTHVDNSIKDPLNAIKTNSIGVANLLEVVKEKKIARFVQISTDEVFGSIEKGEFTEDSPFKPNSPYSSGKAAGDMFCRAYIETYHLPIIVTHATNNVGPYQFPEKLIPLFVTNILENKKVPVYGNGLNTREWTYVLDHAKAIETVLLKGKEGEVYNIGTGIRKTNLDITKFILSYFNKGEESIEYVQDRLGHDFRYAVDSSKIRNELGWKEEYSFEDMLKSTIKWYTDNENWWKTLKDKKI